MDIINWQVNFKKRSLSMDDFPSMFKYGRKIRRVLVNSQSFTDGTLKCVNRNKNCPNLHRKFSFFQIFCKKIYNLTTKTIFWEGPLCWTHSTGYVEKVCEKKFCVLFKFLVQLANLKWRKPECWTNGILSKCEILGILGGNQWGSIFLQFWICTVYIKYYSIS